MTWDVSARARCWAQGMNYRLAATRGSAAIRIALIRLALRRRRDIPDLVVLAVDQTRSEHYVSG